MPLLLAPLVGLLLGPGVNLEWSAPAGCPGQAQVLADVERLLGGRRPATEVVARASVVREPAGLTASVTIDGTAPRALRARECVALARAVALVIAVAVDPVALAEQSLAGDVAPAEPAPAAPPIVPGPPPIVPAPVIADPRPAPIAARPVAVADDRPAPLAGERAANEPPRLRHAIGVRGGLLLGATPSPTGAVALAYSLDRGLLRVEGRALYAAPRRHDYPDGVGARLQALTLGALACVAPGGPRVRFPLCLGLEAGPLIARPRGAAAPRLRADLWASGLAGLGLVARLHDRVALVLTGEFAVALRRPAFHVGDRAELTRAPALGVRALVGLDFFLPGS